MGHWSEFFQDEYGRLSMSRLLMFGSFIVTSAIMLIVPMNEGYFSMYLGAYAGTYLIGKGIDMQGARKKEEKE